MSNAIPYSTSGFSTSSSSSGGGFVIVATLPAIDTAETDLIYLLKSGDDDYTGHIVTTESNGVLEWRTVGNVSFVDSKPAAADTVRGGVYVSKDSGTAWYRRDHIVNTAAALTSSVYTRAAVPIFEGSFVSEPSSSPTNSPAAPTAEVYAHVDILLNGSTKGIRINLVSSNSIYRGANGNATQLFIETSSVPSNPYFFINHTTYASLYLRADVSAANLTLGDIKTAMEREGTSNITTSYTGGGLSTDALTSTNWPPNPIPTFSGGVDASSGGILFYYDTNTGRFRDTTFGGTWADRNNQLSILLSTNFGVNTDLIFLNHSQSVHGIEFANAISAHDGFTFTNTSINTFIYYNTTNSQMEQLDPNDYVAAYDTDTISILELGGISLGPETNTFGTSSTTNKAAAEALRNTYASSNSSWLTKYNDNLSYYIRLVWTGNASAIQRRNSGGTSWEDVTSIISGPEGPEGPASTSATVSTDATITGSGASSSPLGVASPYTSAEKTKLSGVEAGAEVNIQSDWSSSSSSNDNFIYNKPNLDGLSRIPTNNPPSNKVWKTDSSGSAGWRDDEVGATGSGEANVQVDWDVTDTTSDSFILNKPTTLSTVSTDTTVDGDGSSSSPLAVANPFTSTDETKLDGIETGAEVNVNPNWNSSDTSNDNYIENKPDLSSISRIPTANAGNEKVWKTNTTGVPGWRDDEVGAPGSGEANVQSDWSEADTSSDAFILNKPTSLSGTVSTDSTISGDGSASDPLKVANPFTSTDETKLDGIETSATADQSNSEIKTAYENNSDTNAFSDSLKTTVEGVSTTYAALAGAVFTGAAAGINPTADAHFVTLDYFNNNASTVSTPTDDIYFGISEDTVPENDELTIAATNGVGTISSYSGDRYHLIARLATESDITSILYSDDVSSTNQIAAFTKYTSTVTPTPETQPFNVWVSHQNLTQALAVTITVT